MKKFLALCLASTLAGSPAWAAFTETQVTNGNVQNQSSTTLSTGSVSIAQNHMAVIVGHVRGTAAGSVSVADQKSNTYTVYACQTPTTNSWTYIAWALMTTALSANTITATFSGTVSGQDFATWDITGMAASSPEDTVVRACNGSSTTTTTPSVTSGVPSQSNELFFTGWGIENATGTSLTANGSWVPVNGYGTGNSTSVSLSLYLPPPSSGAQTFAPTTSAQIYSMPITAFKPLVSSSACQSLSLLGVGC